jgi:DNA polymerase-4
MILHLDLDCFFASAHRINNKRLQNIPLAVGGRSNLNIFDKEKQKRVMSNVDGAFTSSILSSNENKNFDEYYRDNDGRIRGIITTSTYEARAYGVKTAMSVSEAIRLCPTLTVVAPNYPLYHDLSHKLRLLLEKELPSVEQFSIDEFFTDASGWIKDEDIYEFALKLKNKILDDLGLPISIGIAKTKWIAKLATNDAKPSGVKLINKNEVEEYIKNKEISCFPGIGKNYEQRLIKYGIKKLGDIKQRKELFYSWKKPGIQLYNRVCGIDNERLSHKKDKKSIGLGRTFDPISSRYEIRRRIVILCRHLSFLSLKSKLYPMTYAINIRYEYGGKEKDYVNINRTFSENLFKKSIIELFNKIDIHKSHNIIQLNITLSNFTKDKYTTMDMFSLEEDTKQKDLSHTMQKLRSKFGIDIIKSANEM